MKTMGNFCEKVSGGHRIVDVLPDNGYIAAAIEIKALIKSPEWKSYMAKFCECYKN